MERELNLLGEPVANFAVESWGNPSFGRFQKAGENFLNEYQKLKHHLL